MLPESDAEFLTEKGYRYETTTEGGAINIVIREYRMPGAYKPEVVDMLIRLPAGYPNANPDMFWTLPNVTLANGTPPRAAEVHEAHLGKQWQRWSRHVPGWRPGLDGLRSFMTSIRRELDKGI